MFCEKCGNQVKDTEQFCSKCGAIMKTEEAKEPTRQVEKLALENSEKISEITASAAESAKKIGEKGKELWERLTGNVKKPVLIAGAAVVFLLIIAVANASKLNNFVHKTFSSPEKYYLFVEKQTAKDLAVLGGELYNSYVEGMNYHDKSISAGIDVELGEEGKELIDLFGVIGLDLSWLEKAHLDVDAAVKDNVFSVGASAAANKDDILSGNAVINIEDGEAYLQIPELTKTYLGVVLEDVLGDYDYEMFEQITESQEINKNLIKVLPSQAKMEKLIEKYLKIALGCVDKDNVDMKPKTLKAEQIQQNCTEIKIVFDSDTLDEIQKTVYEAMEDDKELEKIINAFAEQMLSTADYDWDADDVYEAFMEGAEDVLSRLTYLTDGDEEIEMKVYVDSKGDIKGRSIEWDGNTIKVLMPEKGRKYGHEISASVYGYKVGITGSGERTEDSISGDYSIEYNGTSFVDVQVKKLDLESLKKGRLNGEFEAVASSKVSKITNAFMYSELLSTTIKDAKITLKADTSTNAWTYKLGLFLAEGDVGTVSVSAKTGSGSKAKVPSGKGAVIVEDFDDLEEWAESIVWSNLIKRLEKTDLPGEVIDLLEDVSELVEDGEYEEIMWMLF